VSAHYVGHTKWHWYFLIGEMSEGDITLGIAFVMQSNVSCFTSHQLAMDLPLACFKRCVCVMCHTKRTHINLIDMNLINRGNYVR
jgi:hypothetical protein